MKRFATALTKNILKALFYGTIGAFVILLVAGIKLLNDKPDLQVWHTAILDEEYTTSSTVGSLEQYLALEERLFLQLDEEVYDKFSPSEATRIQRYSSGSLSDPTAWEPNWNRTFELPVSSPRGAVLLLHGLSDSPYSLRAISETLQQEGYHVLGLRIPGHGTAPSGLTRVKWEDMAAAVTLGIMHLDSIQGDTPISIIGYSNGGALAIHYALQTLSDPGLPKLHRLALLSPEIGITPMAAFAVWQQRIGSLLGLKKLEWNSVLPEYDPYKYSSFAVNAGRQPHELTVNNRQILHQLAATDRLRDFPPTLTFQSAVDATVSTRALVRDLYNKLPAQREHELVIYGLNRATDMEHLLRENPRHGIERLQENPLRRYDLTVVTNLYPDSEVVVARAYLAGQSTPTETRLDARWPDSVYSLTHVALPFPEEDTTYGSGSESTPGRIHLGKLALRGERGVLTISADDMLRLRWNPFYHYQEQQIINFIGSVDLTSGTLVP